MKTTRENLPSRRLELRRRDYDTSIWAIQHPACMYRTSLVVMIPCIAFTIELHTITIRPVHADEQRLGWRT